MAKVTLENLVKTYPERNGPGVTAVNGINLAIEDREFMVLVGPSGCGKSTTLRMIAGLEDISAGRISIDGRVVNNVLPRDRDIAMVFQNYALYPHMTVYENMAFGLRMRKLARSEIDARVREAADMLGLGTHLDRLPKALSGGQRQRVAVGRAIVRKPKVFLFDEPLSNLDAKMRVSTRAEISKLHARLDATMIYVTHDQTEAMTMGDRICVMKDGDIMQVAEPLELYDNPKNLFVAGFIGSPPMNFFRGTLARDGGRMIFTETNPEQPPVTLALDESLAARAAGHSGKTVVLGIRPENVTLPSPASAHAATAEVRIEVVEPMGSETFLYLNSGATAFIARVPPGGRYVMDQRIRVAFDPNKARLFDAVTGQAL